MQPVHKWCSSVGSSGTFPSSCRSTLAGVTGLVSLVTQLSIMQYFHHVTFSASCMWRISIVSSATSYWREQVMQWNDMLLVVSVVNSSQGHWHSPYGTTADTFLCRRWLPLCHLWFSVSTLRSWSLFCFYYYKAAHQTTLVNCHICSCLTFTDKAKIIKIVLY